MLTAAHCVGLWVTLAAPLAGEGAGGEQAEGRGGVRGQCPGLGDSGSGWLWGRQGEPSGSESLETVLLGGDDQVPAPTRLPGEVPGLSPREPQKYRVQMGQLRLYDHDQLHNVAEIIRHPKFNVSLSAWGGADIALLRLEAPVTLSQHVNPVSLAPDSLVLSPGTKCWVTGWGTFGAHGKTGEGPRGGTRQRTRGCSGDRTAHGLGRWGNMPVTDGPAGLLATHPRPGLRRHLRTSLFKLGQQPTSEGSLLLQLGTQGLGTRPAGRGSLLCFPGRPPSRASLPARLPRLFAHGRLRRGN